MIVSPITAAAVLESMRLVNYDLFEAVYSSWQLSNPDVPSDLGRLFGFGSSPVLHAG
jgi:hypothetical protein